MIGRLVEGKSERLGRGRLRSNLDDGVLGGTPPRSAPNVEEWARCRAAAGCPHGPDQLGPTIRPGVALTRPKGCLYDACPANEADRSEGAQEDRCGIKLLRSGADDPLRKVLGASWPGVAAPPSIRYSVALGSSPHDHVIRVTAKLSASVRSDSSFGSVPQ